MSRIFLFLTIIIASTSLGRGSEALTTREVVRGFSALTYVDDQGNVHKYALFVPRSWRPGQKLPLLMFLNGQGQNGNDGVNQIKNNFGLPIWEMQEFFPFLALAPQCRTGSSWNENSDDSRWAMEILQVVVNEFGADEDRVTLTGVSGGGSGVWQIGSKYADRFAAIVPLCGKAGELNRITQAQLPIWSFFNEGDKPDLLKDSRRVRDLLIKQGQSPLFTEFPQPGHDCWNLAYRLPTLYCWLLEQRKSQNKTESLFEYLSAKQMLNDWSPRGQEGIGWREVESDVLATVGSEEERLLVSNASATDFEIHADIWFEEHSSAQLALIPDEKGPPARELRIDFKLPNDGCGGVFWMPAYDWISDTGLAAQQSLKARRWNDVRIRLLNDRLTVKINGWVATVVEVTSASANERIRYRNGIVVPAAAKEVRWRYVRQRQLKSETTVDMEGRARIPPSR